MDKTFGDLEPGDSVYIKENSGPFREVIFEEFASIMDTEMIGVKRTPGKTISYFGADKTKFISIERNIIITSERDIAEFYDYFWRLRD